MLGVSAEAVSETAIWVPLCAAWRMPLAAGRRPLAEGDGATGTEVGSGAGRTPGGNAAGPGAPLPDGAPPPDPDGGD